ncbi:class I adenylate-forming enzyme family protein [Amycolatopsis sp. WGS_07]|uniref:class I adenylate-forming enzyme family protein n=1 Tax=Amycolatopsis sp. WGS_07 TaxID=3076764 RepID=UPI0038733AC5
MSADTLPEILAQTYEAHGTAPALLHDGRWLTFAETARLALAIHALLAEHGAAEGDRVVVHLENGVTTWLLDQALLGFGLVRVAVSARLHAREVAAICLDAEAAVVCADPGQADLLRAALRDAGARTVVVGLDADCPPDPSGTEPTALARPQPDDVAMLMYSSGTTGAPKAAVVTQAAWAARTRNSLAQLAPVTESDTVVLAAPAAHFAGSVALDCFTQGARMVIERRFDAETVLDLVDRYDGTVVPLVPVLLARLVEAATARPASGRSIRCLPYGGSAVSADVLARASRRFPDVLTQFYGLAEALAPLTALAPADHDESAASRLASAGRFVDGIEHRVNDGVLEVRGPVVMPGYWRRPDLDAEVLSDGWFTTGDQAEVDDDGYLRLTGRSSDVIVSGGYNIQPREVEQVIEQIPGIADVAVAGVPDPQWGEAVHAFVVVSADPLRDKETLEAVLREACAGAIASYKKPRYVHLRNSLPRNHYGKVDRRALRASVAPVPPTKEKE